MQDSVKTYNCEDQENPNWKLREYKAVELIVEYLETSKIHRPIIGDFGCGNCGIEKLLSSKINSGFRYYSYDINPQQSSTIKLDFNHEFPEKQQFNIAICLGTLEYLEDVNSFLYKLRKASDSLILSYVFDSNQYSDEEIRNLGWANHFTLDEINSIIKKLGFYWENELILEKKYFLRLLS